MRGLACCSHQVAPPILQDLPRQLFSFHIESQCLREFHLKTIPAGCVYDVRLRLCKAVDGGQYDTRPKSLAARSMPLQVSIHGVQTDVAFSKLNVVTGRECG